MTEPTGPWIVKWRADGGSEEQSEEFDDELLAWRAFGKALNKIAVDQGGAAAFRVIDGDAARSIVQFATEICCHCGGLCKGERGLYMGDERRPLCSHCLELVRDTLKQTWIEGLGTC
jgi:hypothetical protein